MTQYTLKKIKPLKHVESGQLVAAANLVDALQRGIPPEREDLEVIGLVCQEMLRGVAPEAAWGLTQGRGRPNESGFTNAEIVSAYIELEYRNLGKKRGALTAAKNMAASAFGSYRKPDPRKIEDYWRNGKSLAKALSDDDLRSLLSLQAIPDKK